MRGFTLLNARFALYADVFSILVSDEADDLYDNDEFIIYELHDFLHDSYIFLTTFQFQFQFQFPFYQKTLLDFYYKNEP